MARERQVNTGPILDKLAGIRRQIRLLLGLNALCVILTAAGALTTLSFLLDWLFQLPWGARAVLLVSMTVAMVLVAFRFFFGPIRLGMSDDSLALVVEKGNPEYGDELISALQMARELECGESNESPELMASVVSSAVKRFQGTSFSRALNARFLLPPAFMSVAAVLLVTGYGVSVPAHADLWFDRCVLLMDREWPPRTQLDVRIANMDKYRHEQDGDMTTVYVPEHSPLRIEVSARGEAPSTVEIRKRNLPLDGNPRSITIEMSARADSHEYEHKFGRIASSFQFHVEGGDDNDDKPTFRILVRSAPRIADLEVNYDYPDYINETGEEDRTGVKEYNIVGPVGTTVEMGFTTSSQLTRFDLTLDEDQVTQIRPNPENPHLYHHRFVLDEDHLYTYRLMGENGASSREAPNFNISAQPDLPPQLGIYLPETGAVDITPTATLPLKFQVSDDWSIGEILYRWDTSREGAFPHRVDLQPGDLRELAGRREVSAFTPLAIADFKIVEDGVERGVRSGDTLYLRLEATDTRVTTKNPEPNQARYPSLIVLHVREPVEVERDLMRTQIRIKDQVKRVEEAVRTRIEEIHTALEGTGRLETDRDNYMNSLYGLVSAQDLVTSSLAESSRGFVRVFSGYLFNRLDPSNLTESMIGTLCNSHRLGDGTHHEFISGLIPNVRSQIDDSETMGKLTRIMDLLLDTSESLSPGVSQSLKKALDANTADATRKGLTNAEARVRKLHEQLLVLVEKMEEWEDYQDVIQSLQDIIELEKGLWNRMKKIAK